MKRLLILSCSQRKRADIGLLPAIERYDGPPFRLLRRFLKQSASAPSVYILSAEFGLIPTNRLIPYYDRRMTPQRAQELRGHVAAKLKCIFKSKAATGTKLPTWELFVSMGKEYLEVFKWGDFVYSRDSVVQIAGGSQGKKLAELYNWLYKDSPLCRRNIMPDDPQGKARIRGIDVVFTTSQVLKIARASLAKGVGNPAGYESWYVVVDEHRVAPKWLVSQLTSLPVSSFATDEAIRVLTQLGIEVKRV